MDMKIKLSSMASLLKPNPYFLILTSITLLILLSPTSSKPLYHPLDHLSPSEISTIKTLVEKSYYLTPNHHYRHNLTFQYVGLDEPEKRSVLEYLDSHKPIKPPPRRALVHARFNHKTLEIIVDLSKNSIVSKREYTGKGFPMFSVEEQGKANELSKKHGPLLESVKKRGLEADQVFCSTFSVGWYGETFPKRGMKVQCFYTNGTANLYVRPLEGILLVVDLDEMSVIEYHDNEIIPMPKAEGTEFVEANLKPPFGPRLNNNVLVVSPNGPGFKMDGNVISWANWKFHLGFDSRVGVVISQASIHDLEKRKYRKVLYRAFVSELFVPYMDPTEDVYYKTFFDCGEFGFGQSAVPLKPHGDCPSNAEFIDVFYAGMDGNPVKISKAICVFEKHAGDILWRHTETAIPGEEINEARHDVSLVVRMVSTVGNYDYIIDWEFKPSGSIKFGVGLTGVLEIKAVKYTHIDQVNEDLYGALLSDNSVGIHHDHYLNYYLDLDVDGEANSFMKTTLLTKRQQKVGNRTVTPRKSYWTPKTEIAKTELEARQRLGPPPSELAIINPNKRTKVGNNFGYRLIPGPVAVPLLTADDFPQRRAAFTNYDIWVTPYNKSEKWAGGDFVDQGQAGDNLEIWTQRDRNIENKDIVLWYTIGFHHVPSQEEFPVMPTLHGGFELRPTNFFESNPVRKVKTPKHVSLPKCINN